MKAYLAGLNSTRDVLDTESHLRGPLGDGLLLSASASLGTGLKTSLLGGLLFRAVLVQQAERLRSWNGRDL